MTFLGNKMSEVIGPKSPRDSMPEWISVRDAAALLGVTRRHVFRIIEFAKVGANAVRVRRDEAGKRSRWLLNARDLLVRNRDAWPSRAPVPWEPEIRCYTKWYVIALTQLLIQFRPRVVTRIGAADCSSPIGPCPRDWFTVPRAAVYLGVSERHIWRLVRQSRSDKALIALRTDRAARRPAVLLDASDLWRYRIAAAAMRLPAFRGLLSSERARYLRYACLSVALDVEDELDRNFSFEPKDLLEKARNIVARRRYLSSLKEIPESGTKRAAGHLITDYKRKLRSIARYERGWG